MLASIGRFWLYYRVLRDGRVYFTELLAEPASGD
jgi:hypothetical protein